MTHPTPPPPDGATATRDPGDDIASRYRYQATWAATVCCSLLDPTADIREVFCEHHEDVLLKHPDGRFSGLQIKTRDSAQPLWKTKDITSVFVRFARHERSFPGHFREYRFLTNHPLYRAQNGQDIFHVLQTIRTTPSFPELPKAIADSVSAVARAAECSTDIVLAALSKTVAHDSLPKLPDGDTRLIRTLAHLWPDAQQSSHAAVSRAALALVSACWRASSLADRDLLPAYVSVLPSPADHQATARLAAKRITIDRVLDILWEGLHHTAALNAPPLSLSEPGAGSTHLLTQKLNAGGFSLVSLYSARDLRNKSDYLALQWTKKHGRSPGLQRYSHIRSLVLRDAAMAFEETKTAGRAFGPAMLGSLRSRLQDRMRHGSQLYDASIEHLEGMAYVLTSECLLHWSLDRPWEDG